MASDPLDSILFGDERVHLCIPPGLRQLMYVESLGQTEKWYLARFLTVSSKPRFFTLLSGTSGFYFWNFFLKSTSDPYQNKEKSALTYLLILIPVTVGKT